MGTPNLFWVKETIARKEELTNGFFDQYISYILGGRKPTEVISFWKRRDTKSTTICDAAASKYGAPIFQREIQNYES